jgi:hypothetical protein
MSDTTGGHPLEQLSAYLDDELPVEDRAPIDRHLALCPDCREHLEALRRMSGAIAGEPVPPLPGDLEDKVLRRIDAATVVPLRRRGFVIPASIAATVAAVGLVAVVAWKRGGVELAPSLDRGANQTAATAGAEKVATEPPPAPIPPPARVALPVPAGAPGDESARFKRDDAIADKAMMKAPSTAQDAEGVPGGVVGGVLGGVAGGVDEPEAVVSAKAKDERPAEAIGRMSRVEPSASLASASRNEANAPLAPCADPVDDLPGEARWEVPDRAAAVRDLVSLAAAHGGRLEIPGVVSPTTFSIVVPRERYADFQSAARSMGLGGLGDPQAIAGAGCVRQRVVVRVVAGR